MQVLIVIVFGIRHRLFNIAYKMTVYKSQNVCYCIICLFLIHMVHKDPVISLYARSFVIVI